MKKFFLLLLVSLQISAEQSKKIIGTVTFSWNKIGDLNFVIKYRGEEIHPLASWHRTAGGYKTKEAKKMQNKVIHSTKLAMGTFYRTNKITCNLWDYFLSFFVTPPQVGSQTYILHEDLSEQYAGPPGKTKEVFVNQCRRCLVDFHKLQELRV